MCHHLRTRTFLLTCWRACDCHHLCLRLCLCVPMTAAPVPVCRCCACSWSTMYIIETKSRKRSSFHLLLSVFFQHSCRRNHVLCPRQKPRKSSEKVTFPPRREAPLPLYPEVATNTTYIPFSGHGPCFTGKGAMTLTCGSPYALTIMKRKLFKHSKEC